MWLFTQNGFTSVVQHPDNPQLLVVRFRDKEDAKVFGKRLDIKPVYSPNNDYRWRVVVSRIKFRKLISKWIADIDYTNFKNRIHKQGNTARNQAYTDVWSDMLMFQHEESGEPIRGLR